MKYNKENKEYVFTCIHGIESRVPEKYILTPILKNLDCEQCFIDRKNTHCYQFEISILN